MGRPQRQRRICSQPDYTGFTPDEAMEPESVILTLDEFEVIRLVDLEKQTHEQCAKQMEISRSTVTEIYESARKKLQTAWSTAATWRSGAAATVSVTAHPAGAISSGAKSTGGSSLRRKNISRRSR